MSEPHLLNVFLCHAHEDKAKVRKFFKKLKAELWIDPWLDIENLLPGQDWENEITKVLSNVTNVIIVFLTKLSVTKMGFVQKEIKIALDVADRMPESRIFIIPLLLEECEVPARLARWHYVDYYKNKTEGYYKVLQSLKTRANEIGVDFNRTVLTKTVKSNLAKSSKEGSFEYKFRIPDSDTKVVIVMILGGHRQDYDFFRINTTRHILSKASNEDEVNIRILDVKEGSVILRIELPETAARELAYLLKNRDPKILDYLDVKEFYREDQPSIRIIVRPASFKLHSKFSKFFVGREYELSVFRQLLRNPQGKICTPFILGDGGIGKTILLERMLAEAYTEGVSCATDPIDLSATAYRHIDGIQWKIKEIVESLPELEGQPSPFAEFVKDKTDTSEKFHECLKAYCGKHPLVLAFDTFERLDKVASDWLFSNEEGGLQVPGLICIIAGRDKEIADIQTYCRKPFVKEIWVSGFTLEETNEFYQRIAGEFVDPLGDFLRAAGIDLADSAQKGIEWLWKITEGHPLRLEMAFRWSGTLLAEKGLTNLTAGKFEERLMREVRVLNELGLLDVGPHKVSRPVFDTLVCMAYITRRFDDKLLRFLIDQRLIHLSKPNLSEKDILDDLEKYFFVKIRFDSRGEQVVLLHDEMARLIREYIWPELDTSGEKKDALLTAVDRYYDQLIAERAGEETDILRVEKLYYALERDWKEEGKRLWFKLAGSGNDNIKKLLPGEIKDYIKYYDVETQYEINRRIADIESDAYHFNQSVGYWERVKKLGEAEKRPDWMVDALVGKFCAGWQIDPEKALKSCLEPARKLAEAQVPAKKVLVYYEIGFAYRQMQDMEKAIKKYERAIREFCNQPVDDPLVATVLNDAGYVYFQLGQWGEASRYLNAALEIRKNVLLESEIPLKDGKPDEIDALQQLRSRAALLVGMSYNTLGEFHRHAEQLDEGLANFEKAYEIFAKENNYYWQAKSLVGRGETRRRLALQAAGRNNKNKYAADVKKAQEDMAASLYLCEKYQLNDERDAAYRLSGRISHDLASDAMRQNNMLDAMTFLEDAYNHFAHGLEFARKTKDVLEELENLAELAFLLDDVLKAFGSKKIPSHYKKALGEFERALREHADDKPPIYHLPVFEALLHLEQGAVALTDGNYARALNHYIQGYTRLAVLPGYGITRYKQHFPHLARQIEKLPKDQKVRWYKKFIETWENTIVHGKKKTLAEYDLNPGLAIWCKKKLNELGKR